jgi:hypothetical protein
MGTANRDASQVTVRNRNKAANSYYNDWKSATMTPANGISNAAATSPAGAGAAVISEIKLGCMACNEENTTTDPNQQRYPFNPSSSSRF